MEQKKDSFECLWNIIIVVLLMLNVFFIVKTIYIYKLQVNGDILETA